MSDCLIEKRPDGVALITLNRPESLNSLGGDLVPLLEEHLNDCERDPAVRCVALTGAGRAFCAGGDIGGMQKRNDRQTEDANSPANTIAHLERLTRELKRSQRATSLKLHTMGKPTVALVNGHAVGAGLSLALACDMRIAGDRAKFGTAFRNVGLSGDYGSSYFLPRIVGPTKARDLFFSAEIFDAARALELGIVSRVVPGDDLLAEGLAFCAKLATGPTAAYARMKDNLAFAETATLAELLDHEAMHQRLAGMSRDSREAVASFLEKREARFTGE